ncbi:DNA-formamidopyrimidine glycosylase family protein [Leifsonia poae]|uniref:DNA-formamidopyrimidine glycosylase family protein n=1 Tax=Leifsonia poae TaxID=110933 RepID=UPI001CC1128A|nr:DNA-formamidopyrimidine glycosylase family protein [Leifsonia poae]
MPEGDTVYRTARLLNDALAGRILTETDFRVPAFATVDLAGQPVDEVLSRGKHLLARIGEHTVHSHLKMEGSWELYTPGGPWRHPAFQARAVLRTAQTVAVGFQLGVLEVLPRDREQDAVGHLGPDLLGPDWDADEAVRRLAAHPAQPIAAALLDQRNLAGIGNEYVNEICFLRGMPPTRPVAETDLPATVSLARRLLLANRDRPRRVTTGDTRRGRTSWVHGRQGEPCRRCGTLIERSTLSRVSYSCPVCQR